MWRAHGFSAGRRAGRRCPFSAGKHRHGSALFLLPNPLCADKKDTAPPARVPHTTCNRLIAAAIVAVACVRARIGDENPCFSESILRAHTPLISLVLLLLVFPAIASAADHTAADNTNGAAATPAAVAGNRPNPQPLPIPVFQYGFEERIRTEEWNNIADYSHRTDDERHQVRFRTRSWFSLGNEDAELYVRLDSEFKKQTLPGVRLNMDEVLFDNLYLDIKKTPIPGVSVRIGRQDLMRGEGFIILDGSSGDGSRSTYFNAINVSYTHKKSKLELLGILDPRQERFLPLVHDQGKYLNEWDEQAVGLYYTDRNHKNTDIDGYYFHKKEVHDYRAASNAQFQPDRHIETLGTRVVQRLTPTISITGEFAGQWGAQRANLATGAPAADIQAWGGYSYLKKTFAKKKMKPYILGGVWALSGDDPGTANQVEGFDPIFSRWPKWSELYIYSEVPERGVAYWTNNRMFQAEAGFTPWQPITFRATLYEEDAFQPYAKGKPTLFSRGKHRGENLQLRMDYTLNANVKGHILYESFAPGNFYTTRANGYFFRAEIMYTFKGALGPIKKH